MSPIIGKPLDRVDGPLKVTGTATYPSDVSLRGMAHAVLVQSTIPSGRIASIKSSAAERAPGVLSVVTHENAPTLVRGPTSALGLPPLPPLQDDKVLHYGQHVAMVVAETLEQAREAARQIEVTYQAIPPLLSLDDARAVRLKNPFGSDRTRGDAPGALASADVRVVATYSTSANANCPIGLFATVAAWDGDALTLHDSNQWPHAVRECLAQMFGISGDNIRVLTPFVGGAFGAGLRVWPHVALAAVAARVTSRPVKLVLTRGQMFTSVGHRPSSRQRVSLGATNAGELVAIEHSATSTLGVEDDIWNAITTATTEAYRCPNLSTRDEQVRLNVAPPGFMRAPGHAEGSFALESAIDELSYQLGVDPIELRVRNHAEVHPDTGIPWSSDSLLECYKRGAERFGWSKRNPAPRSMRNGHLLVGYGMAGVTFTFYQRPCSARASVHRDGTAFVRSAATDIGTGTYTVMAMLAADVLGFPAERVRFGLGDSAMPNSPQAGGSGLTGALGNAVHAACVNLVQAFLDLVRDDAQSPLRGCTITQVSAGDAGLRLVSDPTRFETYADMLARHDLDDLTVDGQSEPPPETARAATTVVARAGRFAHEPVQATSKLAPVGTHAAQFVEVHVDPELGRVRVARMVAAIGGGRILNEKTARSQIIGACVGGIGMALLEETVLDERGRLVNASLGDYLLAVNADVPNIEVLFVGEPDSMTPIGTKGIGELGLVGVAAAVANAVHHATGRRIRALPILPEKLLD